MSETQNDVDTSTPNEDDQIISIIKARLEAGMFKRCVWRQPGFLPGGFLIMPHPYSLYREVYTPNQHRTHYWRAETTFLDWLNSEFSLLLKRGPDSLFVWIKINSPPSPNNKCSKRYLESYFMDANDGALSVAKPRCGLYSYNSGMFDSQINRYYRYGSAAYKKHIENGDSCAEFYDDSDFNEKGFIIETGEYDWDSNVVGDAEYGKITDGTTCTTTLPLHLPPNCDFEGDDGKKRGSDSDGQESDLHWLDIKVPLFDALLDIQAEQENGVINNFNTSELSAPRG